MKVIGKGAGDYICTVSHTELEKFMNLYYGNMKKKDSPHILQAEANARLMAAAPELFDWLNANCHGYLMEGVYEDIREHVDEYSRMDLARLTIAMRRDWKRFDGNGLMPIPKLPAPLKLGEAR